MPGIEDERRPVLEGIRALVVDDEPMNLVVAKNVFKRYGMTVTTANSGQESIDLCREQNFDIVFMDHMMPGMDGVEAMKHIRAGKVCGHADMPIVALTANAVSTAKEMFLSVGFDGFVSKPIELVELERVLKKVLPRTAVTFADGTALPEEEEEMFHADETAPAEESEAPETPAEQELTLLEKLEALGIDTAVGMGYCMDDEELYSTLLMQFVEEAPSKRKAMAESFEAGDLKNYAIYVHGLKSTSRMIGDSDLGSRAEALEFASKDGNAEFVKEHHAEMTEDYLRITEGICKALGIEPPAPNAGDPAKGGE